MSLKYTMFLKRNRFISALPFTLYVLLGILAVSVSAQPLNENTSTTENNGIGIKVQPKDVEEARAKAEEIKAYVDKSLHELESFISNLQKDIDATNGYLENLHQDKKSYQTGESDPKFLELLNIELSTIKGKIDVNNELIKAYKDQTSALQDQLKSYTDHVESLESLLQLSQMVAALSLDQIPILKQEADVTRSYITTAYVTLKERDTIVSFFTQELKDVKERVSDREQDFSEYLETLRIGISVDEHLDIVQEKVDNTLLWKKTIGAQWVTIFTTRLETAKIRYDQARQALKNTELQAAFINEKISYLEKQFMAEELKKKQADLEAAKKVAEMNQKIAETNRVEVKKALREAIERGEEIEIEQITTTSQEKKKVLELEADVHKQTILVANKKDELIQEGAQRYKDITEFKELEADIELFFSRGSTTKEIEEMYKKAESEILRFSNAKAVAESLIASLTEEEKLFSENLDATRKEIAKVEGEVIAFEDKELARQAVAHAQRKVTLQQELLKLLSARTDRLRERVEIKKNVIDLLQTTKEKLIQMKAANVWTRIESKISTGTVKAIYNDAVNYNWWLEFFSGEFQSYGESILSYISDISDKKDAIFFWIRAGGVILLFAGFYFSKRMIQQWCTAKIEILCDKNLTYYNAKVLPSLLIILNKSITIIWLAILSFSVSSIFLIKTPFLRAASFVLGFLAVYKILKGFLVESFGPGKGDRKLITSLAYISPRHIYNALNTILLFSLAFLSVITVLTVFQYRNDVIEFLWFIYRLGILVLLLWLATQKTLIFKLLPSVESPLGRFIYRIIAVLYPLFVIFVVSLFAIRSLGYTVLTYVLLKTCIKSFIIACIAFWIWKYWNNRLNYLREVRLRKSTILKDTPEEKKFHTITNLYHLISNYTISIIAGIVIIKVWVKSFYEALSSPAAPYLVQKIFGQVYTVLTSIGKGLQYRFVFDEGRYTTPIKIIFAVIVLVISFFVARYVKNLMEERVFQKLRLERGSRQTLSSMIRYFIIGIAALIGMNMAGIPLRSLTIFAGAFGIGIGFGMQNIINNFVSGIILLFERPMRVGDVITLDDGTLGTIERINARSTTLLTPDEVTVTVPNAKFIESKITNWTLPTSRMRGRVSVKVTYGSDINLVKKCLLEIAKQNPNVRIHPEPFVRFAEFGDNALAFELYFWADNPGKRWFTQSELNFAIDELFRKNNIEIAFPQRDIHIRSVVPFPVQNIQGQTKQEVVRYAVKEELPLNTDEH
ncbi:MAG: mechanosensitive ion channel [wastewater metagenome]|nr:mechanosensitive ion channel [Candidatus Loosdrechtia aerotolerans]